MELGSEELQFSLSQRLPVNYFYVATTTVLVYDYLLTLKSEITLVWNQPKWTYTKVIFLMARYFPFPGVFMFLYNQIFDVPPQTCKPIHEIACWMGTIGIISAQCIFMVRTWAVLEQNKYIATLFIFLVCGLIAVQGVVEAKAYAAAEVSPTLYQAYHLCFLTTPSKMGFIKLVVFSTFDSVVFAFMTFSAFKAYKNGASHALSKIVYRDGIIFYMCITSLTISGASAVRFAPPSIGELMFPFAGLFYTLLSARVIFNIRRAAIGDPIDGFKLTTELHTTLIFEDRSSSLHLDAEVHTLHLEVSEVPAGKSVSRLTTEASSYC